MLLAMPPKGLTYGARSEWIAERHLTWRGYRIIARNFRAAGAEIDLVAMHRGTLVFVEVKARRSDTMGPPEASVDDHKRAQIRRAAEIFAVRHRARERPMRFDVIAIRGEGRTSTIKHWRNAF